MKLTNMKLTTLAVTRSIAVWPALAALAAVLVFGLEACSGGTDKCCRTQGGSQGRGRTQRPLATVGSGRPVHLDRIDLAAAALDL